MANVHCTTCRALIPADDVNVSEGVAFCRQCERISRLRDIADEAALLDDDVHAAPPRGCTVFTDAESTVIRASCRSIGTALGLGAIAAFWNGIVSIFVLFAIAGTLELILGSVPTWFPAPHSDDDELTGSLGPLLFLWIFLTPFIVIGLSMIAGILTALWGRTEVRLRGREAILFTGVGPIGRRRRFDPERVTDIRLRTKTDSDGDRTTSIEIEADRRRRFGSMLPSKRKGWMLQELRRQLVPTRRLSRSRP